MVLPRHGSLFYQVDFQSNLPKAGRNRAAGSMRLAINPDTKKTNVSFVTLTVDDQCMGKMLQPCPSLKYVCSA